jgi:Mg2+ and Co2+ transporter CorA
MDDQAEIYRALHQLGRGLNDTTACLARIEERLTNFIDRVDTRDKEQKTEFEDVQNHVQTVRTVSKVGAFAMSGIAILAGIYRAIVGH